MDENNNVNESVNTVNETTNNMNETNNNPMENTSVSAFQMPDTSKEGNSSAPSYYSAPEVSSNEYQERKTETSTQTYNYSSSVSNATETPQGFAIASLVMGILSIISCCCGFGILLGILGIIFGCVQQQDEYGKKPTMAIVGIILSVIGLVFGILIIVIYLLTGSIGSSIY